MAEFLDEVTGDFVLHTKASSGIYAIVKARIFPDAPPQSPTYPYLIYTEVSGHRIKTHAGVSSGGARHLTLHVYCVAESQPTANQLARLVEERWLATEGTIGNGTLVQVCNGGIYESGQWFAKDSSDVKAFFSRVVLRMLIGQ